jgi:hypothetical protein
MGPKCTSVIGRAVAAITITLLACSSAGHNTFDPGTSGPDNGNGTGTSTSAGGGSVAGSGSTGKGLGLNVGDLPMDEAGAPHPCVNLECQQTSCSLGSCKEMPCAAGAKTTVSGTVYDPAGKVPLYDVIVYVPNGPVPAITNGASCDKCDASAINPVASALTDTKGHFVLDDVPVGADIPLVIQVGKWRRQLKLPNVARCTDTPITDKEQTRLPRNQSEGDIPLIAITTGGADSMECLPLRMGLDPAEFTTEAGMGRIHLYSGYDHLNGNGTVAEASTKVFDATHNAGTTLTRSDTLWNSLDNLKKYDIVILSCEGDVNVAQKPDTARKALYDYESMGGRVFASHWHHIWFSKGPDPVPTVGTWKDQDDPPNPITGTINTGFPKGQALSDWLVNVGASMTPGQIQIQKARDNVNAVADKIATSWITIQAPKANPTNAVEFMSFNAPIGAADDQICGRAVFNDLHVSATRNDKPGTPFPTSCEAGDLSDQEKALEFMLFDLSSCVRRDDQPPEPPAVVH